MLFEIYKNKNPRLRLFYLVFSLLLLVLLGMLTYRQIIKGKFYREQEKKQSLRRILLPGPRGNIYDREGRLLVGNHPHFSAVVYLGELRPEFRKKYIALVREKRNSSLRIDRNELNILARQEVVQSYLNRINKILDRRDKVERQEVERHFRRNLLLPFPLIRDLEPEEYARLIELIPVESPIQIHTDSARYYPYGSVASHTLGFVGTTFEISEEGLPGANLTTVTFKGKQGRTGLERQFDETLQGSTGGEIWVVDPSGFQYERTSHKLPRKGNDLRVSLDIDLQLAAEKALGDKVGAVAALDVRTGEVYVLASKPDFDLNSLSPFIPNRVYLQISARGAWLNRAIAGLYPPGSTFKIITSIAGLEKGVIEEGTQFDCYGTLRIGNRTFVCNNHSDRGPIGFERAIMKSCNVFFYNVGLQTGAEKISEVAKTFGFDQPTGIELPNETRKMIVPDGEWKQRRKGDRWYEGDTANLAIGQSYLRLTPLQMAAFTASLARRETRTRPTLLHDPARDFREFKHGGSPIPLTDRQYQRLIDGMEQAVQAGSARLARLPGIRVAGKTGTPQIHIKNKLLTMAAFIAFAPVEDPRIALAVVVEPSSTGQHYGGGLTAAPIGKAVLEAYFKKHKHAGEGNLASR